MFKPKITKEEVNQMPVVAFDGKITLIDDLSKVQEAIEEAFVLVLLLVSTLKRSHRLRVAHITKFRWCKFPLLVIVSFFA